MSYRVVVTARAAADALETFRWIAERSPDAAAHWYEALDQAIATLADMPDAVRWPGESSSSESPSGSCFTAAAAASTASFFHRE